MEMDRHTSSKSPFLDSQNASGSTDIERERFPACRDCIFIDRRRVRAHSWTFKTRLSRPESSESAFRHYENAFCLSQTPPIGSFAGPAERIELTKWRPICTPPGKFPNNSNRQFCRTRRAPLRVGLCAEGRPHLARQNKCFCRAT